MSVVVKRRNEIITKSSNMYVGQYAEYRDIFKTVHIVLKTRLGLISITDPDQYWSGDADLVVNYLPKGTVVEITATI